MACGSCRKRRQELAKAATKVVKATKARNIKRASVKHAARKKIASIGVKMTETRCPICRTLMRRVSKRGRGDMLLCANPKCGHIRKL